MTTRSAATSTTGEKPKRTRKPKAEASPVTVQKPERIYPLLDVVGRLNRAMRLRFPNHVTKPGFVSFIRGLGQGEEPRVTPSRESLRIMARRARIVDRNREREFGGDHSFIPHFEDPERLQAVRVGMLSTTENVLGYSTRWRSAPAHAGYGDKFLRAV